MAKAVRVHGVGGPEVMVYEDVTVGQPGAGEVRLKQDFVGLNYIDTYHRTGAYPMPTPFTIGLEAAGIVDAVGDGVDAFKPGDRVAYAAPPIGAYASERLIPWHRLIKLPDSISTEMAAGMMLQGMTVEYLVRRTYPVKKGDTVLFQAAAGGVGLIACQWLKQIGATVIGTVGSEEKAEQAKAHGCDHIIYYNKEDVAKKVREITDGAGVPVVYDGVGKSTLDGSLDSLKPRGLFVSFGAASGPIENFNLGTLSAKGSLFMTRPTLMTYTASREDLVESATALFDAVGKGLKIEINQRYALADAVQAHKDLEARKTTGSTIFVV
ncbi:MAG TPA: quinone oxidoreductase [Rhodospirillaceae bacterium]|nr:quinone oxidoreductase [Rhodospirillaceae bacterium]MAX63697.1 quinone oxidoreductase [Rhodospirillaceae bacterium]MBB56605.1 quinone oxidoreductase [Rhodospirillaceae bacterium]HAD99897.1 quinone oxidoreductase [Rhodospirillaceae bacterium]|tara:strand:+ start:181 stop:1152 length:972 start_codon:yes stop_codon:yes gene_type:complete